MPQLRPPPGWRAADPATPNTPTTWWGTKIDTDENVAKTGWRSVVFYPDTSGTYYLISDKLIPVDPGQRLLARSTFLNDDMDVAESLFITGVALYEADGDYIGIAKTDNYGMAIDAAIAAATNNKWMNMTAHANVNDFANAVYARTVIGVAHTGGDTNTIWVDSADIVIEPPLQIMTREASASFGAGGTQEIGLTAALINADGFFIASSGFAVCLVGGTYVMTGQVEVTLADAISAHAILRKGVYTAGSPTFTTFARGDELHFRTGNLSRWASVTGVERFNPGDILILGLSTTGSGSLADAKLSAVRVGA